MGDAELLPFRVDGSLETECVFVSSEPGGGERDAEDLDGLLHHVCDCEHGFECAQTVLLGKGVIAAVHGAVTEVVVCRAHIRDVFAVACRGVELQSQWFCALELPGCYEQLANAGERAVDECSVTATARELEVLLEQLERSRLFCAHVETPAQRVTRHRELCLVAGGGRELNRVLVSTEDVRFVDVERSEGGQRPGCARSVLCG